jgi:hypothetical protein
MAGSAIHGQAQQGMVIWGGWGILTVLITTLVCGTVSAAGAALPGTTGQQGWTDLALGLGLLAAAAVNWWAGGSTAAPAGC